MLFYLNGIFVGLLILSNIVAVKLISIGDWIVLPGAAIIYVCTYPLLDTITEAYGKEAAHKTVMAGLITQLLASFFIWLAIQIPAAPFYQDQQAFETVMSAGFRVTVASLIAYLISQNLDVVVFDRLKQKHGEKKLWLRNNLSTMTSQLVDTTLFVTIAFIGTMPLPALIGVIASQYVFKFIVALLDTPVVYLLVALCKKNKRRELSQSASTVS